MNWQDKKVLVTGAGGFIGSHLVERLLKLGSQVRAFVRYNSRNDIGQIRFIPSDLRKELQIVAGDLRDYHAVGNAMKGIEIIFHLGALISIPYSYLHPREVVETNILGTLNILNAAREGRVKKVVHTSTSEVYGTAIYIPIDERHPLQGQSPYSASKIGADMLAESFYRSFDLPVSIIRPFNTYGPRQSARAVIPAIITQVLTKDKISLGSLQPTRDFTYVDDIIKAFILIADSDKSIGRCINIGSNFTISIGDLTQKIVNILGKKIKILEDTKRIRPTKSEVYRLQADYQMAKELLNWESKTSLEEGLKKTIDWISKNLHLYDAERYEV